jgi:hypothetical protein
VNSSYGEASRNAATSGFEPKGTLGIMAWRSANPPLI